MNDSIHFFETIRQHEKINLIPINATNKETLENYNNTFLSLQKIVSSYIEDVAKKTTFKEDVKQCFDFAYEFKIKELEKIHNNIMELEKGEIIQWTQINNDIYGNGRIVCHWSTFFGLEYEGEKTYNMALGLAKSIGGKRYHTKGYGGGIVFQDYHRKRLEERINKIKLG